MRRIIIITLFVMALFISVPMLTLASAMAGQVLGSWIDTGASGSFTPRNHVAYAVAKNAAGKSCLFIIGGRKASGIVTNAVEAYNPTTNAWETYAPIPTPREDAAAVSVTDSSGNINIYVTGGCNATGNPLATVEVFNPVTNTWSVKAPLINARSGHAAQVFSMGSGETLVNRIHVYGGSPSSAYEIYDDTTDEWTASVITPPALQSDICAVRANNLTNPWRTPYLYFFSTDCQAWRRDPAGSSEWLPIRTMPEARSLAAAVVIQTKDPSDYGWAEYPIIIGGNTVSGPSKSTMIYLSGPYNGWQIGSIACPDMPEPRGDRPAAGVICDTYGEDNVYVAAGSNATGLATTVFKSHINRTALGISGIFPPLPTPEDPIILSWERVADIPHGHSAGMSAVVDGKLYVIGGTDDNGIISGDVDAYDPQTDTWVTKESMPFPVYRITGCAVGSNIFVISGEPSISPANATTVQIYNTIDDSWMTCLDANSGVACFPTPQAACAKRTAACLLNDNIQVVGGNTSSSIPGSDQHYSYNPSTNIWQTEEAMPWKRLGMMCTGVIDSNSAGSTTAQWLYAGGGLDTSNSQCAEFGRWNASTPLKLWTQLADLPGSRDGGGMTTITTGHNKQYVVYVGGKLKGMATNGFYDSVYIYHDPSEANIGDSWTYETPMGIARGYNPAVAQIGDYIYVTAGADYIRPLKSTIRARIKMTSAAATIATISDAFNLSQGQSANITEPKIVTRTQSAADGTYFWIEEDNRSSAIKVGPTSQNIEPGDKAIVTGVMYNGDNGEIIISSPIITTDSQSNSIPSPIGFTGHSLTDTVMPKTCGMLVKTWGKVTYSSSGSGGCYFYIDDGSTLWDDTGNAGLKVYYKTTKPAVGSVVSVTGIISREMIGGVSVPILLSDEVLNVPTGSTAAVRIY